MRHWQPIHHARWRDFVAGLAAVLSGRPVVPAPTVTRTPEPAPAPVLPPPAKQLPATVPAPAPEPAPEPAIAIVEKAVTSPVVAAQPEPPARLEPPVPSVPAFVEPATAESSIAETPVVQPAATEALADYPPVVPLAEAPLPNLTSRDFFSTLAWSGQIIRSQMPRMETPAAAAAASAPTESAVVFSAEPLPARQQTASTSSAFFGALPWSGANALGDVIKSIRVTASRDDAGLDPRSAPLPGDNPLLTGMLSAARTSDRMAARPPAPARASAYFNAIPWSR